MNIYNLKKVNKVCYSGDMLYADVIHSADSSRWEAHGRFCEHVQWISFPTSQHVLLYNLERVCFHSFEDSFLNLDFKNLMWKLTNKKCAIKPIVYPARPIVVPPSSK